MIAVKTYLFYKAFGLKIKSMIPLPELTCLYEPKETSEVLIEVADFDDYWEEKGALQGKMIVENHKVMFRIPETATFLIKDGQRIIVSPMQNSDENKIRLYILGTCMGVLLMQRKVLALHGSAIAVNGKAYAFVGDSGAGKSTLASAFMKNGYQLLSDDVIPLNINENGIPYVIPSYPQQKLWEESLQNFGMDTANYKPLFDRENKFAIPVHSNYCDHPLPLAGVFEITKTEEVNANVIPILNLERFSTLFSQTFRHTLIPTLGLTEWHFKESASIINNIKMYQIQRPKVGFTAPALVEQILKKIEEEII
jgi:hypothetical protein